VAANVVILDSVFDLKTSGTNLKIKYVIIFCSSKISCPFKIINTGLNLSVRVKRTRSAINFCALCAATELSGIGGRKLSHISISRAAEHIMVQSTLDR
jgi:hypothetical protein